jgi:hypothetical protein
LRRLSTTFALAFTLTAPVLAEEGMWMPQQMPKLAPALKALGFEGDAQAFADLTGQPMGAIVSLGNCSASFVSPEGLLVTNHHCAVAALQYGSKPGRNLLEDGFLAKTRAEESWNGPGARIWVTTAVREVTDAVMNGIDPKVPDGERYATIDRRVKELTAACEKGGSRCRVAPFFGGLQWYEITQLEIQDVRLVYAPASGIGVFGGETDNWRWPRHTGDFTFMRAYVGKDGKPAPHAESNVPFKPKRWLPVSARGASPNDLVFVAGYPGRTERLETVAEVKETTDWYYPRAVRRAKEQLAILEQASKGREATAIAVASKKQGLGNALTNNQGMLEGLLKGGVLAKRGENERALQEWIAADPKRKQEIGDVVAEIAALQAEADATRDRDATLRALVSSSVLLSGADTIHRLSVERQKSDIERDAAYQERNWTRLKDAAQRAQKSYDETADRALLRYTMREAAALPASQRIAPLDRLVGLKAEMPAKDREKAIERYLDKLYRGTSLDDAGKRVALYSAPPAQVASSRDSFLVLARALDELGREVRAKEKEREGALYRLRPRYMRALLEKGGGLVAPDANSTLRITYGRVLGVPAKDGLVYLPQTTLAGIVEKATGEGDFAAPKKELAAIEALRKGKKTPYLDPQLGDVPVNFLSSVDTTGGNSGSAALNGKGELCGLLFDGTYETIASDYLFDTVKTRSINVDIRYVLWVMSEVDGAQNVLAEMELK